jgi:hypothetical protein
MTIKTPIRLVLDGSNNPTGLAEFQTGEIIGVSFGGTGNSTLTSNAILLGNGTSAIQSSPLQLSGSTLSSSDSSIITIDDGLNISGALSVTGNTIITGNLTVNGTTTTINSTTIDLGNQFRFEGTTSDDYETTLTAIDPTGDRTISLPNVSGTIITTGNISDITGLSNSQLTNQSFTLSDDTSSTTTISLGETLKIAGGSGVDTAISGDTLTISLESTIVTETSTDTLTNKSISLNTNTITGTLAEFNTAVSDADLVSLAGSETLTNKSISGSSNTLSNIDNSSLTNSFITLSDDTSSTTTISLGETLKISGDTGITTTISGDTVNIDLDDTAVSPRFLWFFNGCSSNCCRSTR